MPSVSRLDDIALGHDCYPPSEVIQSSENVFASSKGIARIGDEVKEHKCGKKTHSRHLLEGSSTVFVNSIGASRIGDAVDCGGFMATGSGTVILG